MQAGAFNGSRPRPLVAVCGLGGGVGTTTLTYLLALNASKDATAPVLVCDTGGPAAALAAYAGQRSPLGLVVAAEALERGVLNGQLFAQLGDRLRLIAREPILDESGLAPAALAELLGDAREAHELTLVDCGTLQRGAEGAVAARATHVVWVMCGEADDLARARAALRALPATAARELIVARMPAKKGRASTRRLMELARERGAVLVPFPELERPAADPRVACKRAAVALGAICGALR